MHASESDTGEVLSSRYEFNCTVYIGSKAMGGALPLMLVFQGLVPVADRDQGPRIGGFPAFLDSNACGRNCGEMIIKHYHCVLKPWIYTINVSAISERKSLIIFDGCPFHLNIDMLKELGVDGIVVLLHMTNTSHETNVEDLVAFGIAKTEFQNSKQSLMAERLVLGNAAGINRK